MVLHTYFALTTTLSSSASTFTAFTFSSSRSNSFVASAVVKHAALLLTLPRHCYHTGRLAAASSEYSSFNNTHLYHPPNLSSPFGARSTRVDYSPLARCLKLYASCSSPAFAPRARAG